MLYCFRLWPAVFATRRSSQQSLAYGDRTSARRTAQLWVPHRRGTLPRRYHTRRPARRAITGCRRQRQQQIYVAALHQRPCSSKLPLRNSRQGHDQRCGCRRPRPSPGGALLRLRDIHFGYPNGPAVLHGVSLAIHEGEVVTILGPNGAGKSTLLLHAIGLLRSRSGSVEVLGADAGRSTVAQLARSVGYVFQSPSNMLFAPTVRAELLFGPRNIGHNLRETEAQLPATLAQIGLEGYGERAPLSLSFGQQKRLTIGSILTMGPRVLVLDEPTAGQDFGSTRALMQAIGGLRGPDATVLITVACCHLCFASTTSCQTSCTTCAWCWTGGPWTDGYYWRCCECHGSNDGCPL